MTNPPVPTEAVLDQSIELAVYDLIDKLDQGSEELVLLRELANDADVAEGLLELLGLPPDDLADVARQRTEAMGRTRFQLAVAWLKRQGIDLLPIRSGSADPDRR